MHGKPSLHLNPACCDGQQDLSFVLVSRRIEASVCVVSIHQSHLHNNTTKVSSGPGRTLRIHQQKDKKKRQFITKPTTTLPSLQKYPPAGKVSMDSCPLPSGLDLHHVMFGGQTVGPWLEGCHSMPQCCHHSMPWHHVGGSQWYGLPRPTHGGPVAVMLPPMFNVSPAAY